MSRSALRISAAGALVALLMATSQLRAVFENISGISTPESERLDKQAADLEADAERVRLGGHADAFDKSQDLKRRAKELSKKAAHMRADTAAQQRCIDAPADPQTSDPEASSFLCKAAISGGAANGPNNPWDVCRCARDYLRGLDKENTELRDRLKRLVGKKDYEGPITEDRLATQFGDPLFFRKLNDSTEEHFREDAGMIERHPDDPTLKGPNGWQLSTADAYATIQTAVKRLWDFYQNEAGLEMSTLGAETNERSDKLNAAWQQEVEAVEKQWDLGHLSDSQIFAFAADMSQHCKRHDEPDYRFIETAASQLRDVGRRLKETRRRLIRDLQAWGILASQDGFAAGSVQEIFSENQSVPKLELIIGGTRNDPLSLFRSKDPEALSSPSSPCMDWKRNFPADLRLRYPEITEVDNHSLTLTYQIATADKEIEEWSAPGADPLERP